jgi:hypothetical protein
LDITIHQVYTQYKYMGHITIENPCLVRENTCTFHFLFSLATAWFVLHTVSAKCVILCMRGLLFIIWIVELVARFAVIACHVRFPNKKVTCSLVRIPPTWIMLETKGIFNPHFSPIIWMVMRSLHVFRKEECFLVH